MKLMAPDYYTSFKCIADKCMHNCCKGGWIISVDEDTLEYYHSVTGPMGERLKRLALFWIRRVPVRYLIPMVFVTLSRSLVKMPFVKSAETIPDTAVFMQTVQKSA